MRRVQRDTDKEDVVKALTGGETPLFKEIWRLLLFAATLGFKQGRRVPLSSVDSGKAMPQSYFANNPSWPGFLYLLALVSTGSPSLFSGTDESDDGRITIFEEFANGGLGILREELERSSYSLDGLLQFVAANQMSVVNEDLSSIEI